MKKIHFMMIAIFTVFVIAACAAPNESTSNQSSPDTAPAEDVDTSDSEFVIGALWSATSVPPVQVILNRIEEVAAEANGTIVNMDAQFDPQTQATQARNLLTQGVDAVFVNVIDPEGIVPSVKELEEAGIHVIVGTLPVSPSANDYIASFVGPDNIKAGNLAAELMQEALVDGGKVAIIEGDPGITVTERTAGFEQALEGTNIEILEKQVSEQWDRSRALSIMQNYLTKYPDLDGIFVHNDDMAMGAIQALRQEGKLDQVTVISLGGTFEAVDAIEAGEMYGTVTEDLVWTAEMQMDVALKVINGEEVDKVVDVPLGKLTKDNLDSFTPTY
ncbi:sugar ABC transporter substrate-binding protein [Alkalihalobacillus sp. MEB130]|uniref:sugar ABC transporter substrate-binding protein n=1 Tax=Alkalihalobacillus sp. MEB130 TaxID=2976704 RepID=UPI0028DF6F09|nr:sugar ABC transporter substrate-binding protein [Alkalihalobacillus sp. MEB130]MDT8860742.1 sugar ABC transporter substrate-binding protein [Alkalihalobacillus sp. MEB130]